MVKRPQALSGSAAAAANRGAVRTPKQRAGDAAEATACALLQQAGCRIVARNIRYREGELDIVAWDGATLVFVEVRLRRDAGRFGGAAASVDAFKRRRLTRAARHYLAEHFGDSARRWPPCRFDVVAGNGAALDWLRDAFGEGD
ncbi:MAG: YraN family protein [Betaproteobacteria bacterium]